MEDREIIDLYWMRDESAIRETERKYGVYCRAIANNFLPVPEDQEECVSDTWLRAWNAMPPQRPAKLKAFLGRITRNLAINRLRDACSQKRGGGVQHLPLEELRELTGGNDDPLDQLEQARMSACITAFLRLLPLEKRKLFLLRYWYMESITQISDETGCSADKVRSDLYRTRKKLRNYLKKEGFPL